MSKSLSEFQNALGHTDRLIEGTKVGRGAPNAKEATMYAASVAFAYAAWEAYIEDVAIEAVRHLATEIDPANMPVTARDAIHNLKPSPTAWTLTVHPGWRALWRDEVETRAKGDETKGSFGVNTAREAQVRTLFNIVGLDPFASVKKADLATLEDLVSARGSVVHAATTPEDFKKSKAKSYRDLVVRLTEAVDDTLCGQIMTLTSKAPW